MSLLYGITVGEIDNNNIILLLKSDSGRLLSIFLKAMVMGEAIAKVSLIVKGEIIEDGVSHAFTKSIYLSSAVQAFVITKGVNFCGVDSNVVRANALGVIDW